MVTGQRKSQWEDSQLQKVAVESNACWTCVELSPKNEPTKSGSSFNREFRNSVYRVSRTRIGK